MEIVLGVLVFVVAALAVLQGWQMLQSRRNRHKPSNPGNPGIGPKLDTIISQLGKMGQRLEDIWDKIKG